MDGHVDNYRTTDIMGMSQVDMILKVYDGAIGAIEQAGQFYVNEEMNDGHDQIERARKMLVHLYTTLDEEKGGEVAENLGKLYTYLICQLDIVQATKDQSVIESSVKVLKNLREGWDGIATETQAGQTQQQDQTAANPTRGKLSISG